MPRKTWAVVAPVLVLMGLSGSLVLNPILTRGADPRIADERLYNLEKKLGHHVYAPTWLPHAGRVGVQGAMQGKIRILQDFVDKEDRSLCILSQERRRAERDAYHNRLFVKRAEATVDVEGSPGYFVTGNGGERRLFWQEEGTSVILSSCILTDDEMTDVARSVR